MAKKVVKKEKVNFEIPAYVLGILSIIQAFFNPLSAVVLGIVGLIFSKRQATPMSRKAKTLNTIGLVLGIIFSILLVVFSYILPQQITGF